jgi:hypothetical protein
MKKAILLLLLSLFFMQKNGSAQQLSGQEKEWKKVDVLEKKGLYRTAWTAVKKIYTDAVRHHYDQQQLKALIYGLKYRSKIEEQANVTNIREVDSLADRATGIPKAILQSMLAQMYRSYAQSNRYTLYQRITSASEDENDVTTWSLSHFYKRITSAYEASLEDADALKKIALKNLQVVVDTGKNTLALQPTLYDLLAHRALDYFTGEEQNVIRPAEQFVIDQPAAFDPAKAFSETRFSYRDSTSLPLRALQLYQQLIRFHLADGNSAALMEADLSRLEFVYRKAVVADKDSLYTRALTHIIAQNAGPAATAQASALLARWYVDQGSGYDAFTHPQNQFAFRKALEICRRVPASPVTAGSLSCRQLKASILSPDLSMRIEAVNVPEKPFRVLVSYKNAPHVWFRIVKLPGDPKAVYGVGHLTLKDLLGRKVFKHWQQDFPDPGDYQRHEAEMKVDGLPPGRYALMLSGDKDFSQGKYPVESVVFYVSGISCVDNNAGDFLVLDRETGKPLAGATVRLWKGQYNAASRKQELKQTGSYKTDRHGYFRAEADSTQYRNLMPEVTFKGDQIFTGRHRYIPMVSSGDAQTDTPTEKSYLFTDRSIYRPGQTLFFKGITLGFSPHTRESRVIKDKAVQIFLLDANGQQVDSLRLTSNEFGSYAGSFVLPSGSLNGQMHLSVPEDHANAYFSVEDYKRPTFYMKWDSAAHPYRLGDTVDIQGEAIAYSQAVIDGATVDYQVTRHTRIRFPYYPGQRKMVVYPRQETATIAQGVTTTDAKGRFSVRFQALPDEGADSALQPVFVYTISAKVTDIGGESHSFTYALPLGYKSLELQLDVADKVSQGGLDTVHLKSTDLSGRFTAVNATVSLYPLSAPTTYIRPRYWDRPDQYIMDQKVYHASFPHDEYGNESDPETWERKPAAVTLDLETSPGGVITLLLKKTQPGWYALEAKAKDRYGKTVTTTKYVEVYDPGMKAPAFTDPLWLSKAALEAQPGETVSWILGSGQAAHIFRQDERLGKTETPLEVSLQNGVGSQQVRIDNTDHGGMISHYVTVRYNRVYKQDLRVNVPWKNKQLHIQYETFRDKLLPGAHESWRVKITGTGGEAVSAELLASMYDASLDAFRQHNWPSFNNLYPKLSGKIAWQGTEGFNDVSSGSVYQPKPPVYPAYEQVYPSLKWFGYEPLSRHYPPMPRVSRVFNFISMRQSGAAPMAKEANVVGYAEDTAGEVPGDQGTPIAPVRKNFSETAFFMPQLNTDDSGHVIFSFTMPEALTRWKLMLLAHTRDMQYAFSDKEVITQKPMMIQADAPRFVRQGDQLVFSAKVSNLSNEDLQGEATLELTDAATGKTVDALFKNKRTTHDFKVRTGGSTVVKWDMTVPGGYAGVLQYKVMATAGSYSDGEQNALPVLTNRALATESLPLHFRGNGDHKLNFDAIEKMKNSSTLQPQGLTIEYTGNPVWYAVQALPFLDENDQKSSDALYNRFYANVLSGFIAGHIPHFQEIMQKWLGADSAMVKSPLQENESLKTVLLQETPWVQAALDESAQKGAVARWFNGKQNKDRMRAAMSKLEAMQLSNGGFSWFKDMPDDRYITQKILTGIGHLKQLNAWPTAQKDALTRVVGRAVPYLDSRMKATYEELLRGRAKDPSLHPADIQYLYMRSFFPDVEMADSVKTAYDFYRGLAKKQWLKQTPYMQAMLALVLRRAGDASTAKAILRSLTETAIVDPVKGTHWKDSHRGYLWYEAPLEAQTLCIEAFEEIDPGNKIVSDLCAWLLTQKQAQHWATAPATADAIYALLLSGSKWTETSPEINIKTGEKSFALHRGGEIPVQYLQTYIPGKDITPAMGNVQVRVRGAAEGQPTWGALYFQYFENMDKLKNSGNELDVTREVSLEKTTPEGPKLVAVTEGTSLKVGSKAQVRLVVKVQRDMDYVHLKDVRASCMEPLQTLSGYQWEAGVGYYTTVTDAAMHFYFSHLPKGTYVFTYPVYITHTGTYSGGMSTLECLYAPAFRAHSEGVDIRVK